MGIPRILIIMYILTMRDFKSDILYPYSNKYIPNYYFDLIWLVNVINYCIRIGVPLIYCSLHISILVILRHLQMQGIISAAITILATKCYSTVCIFFHEINTPTAAAFITCFQRTPTMLYDFLKKMYWYNLELVRLHIPGRHWPRAQLAHAKVRPKGVGYTLIWRSSIWPVCTHLLQIYDRCLFLFKGLLLYIFINLWNFFSMSAISQFFMFWGLKSIHCLFFFTKVVNTPVLFVVCRNQSNQFFMHTSDSFQQAYAACILIQSNARTNMPSTNSSTLLLQLQHVGLRQLYFCNQYNFLQYTSGAWLKKLHNFYTRSRVLIKESVAGITIIRKKMYFNHARALLYYFSDTYFTYSGSAWRTCNVLVAAIILCKFIRSSWRSDYLYALILKIYLFCLIITHYFFIIR